MLNTSVMDINSTSVPFSFKFCFNGVYVGLVVAYVAFSLGFVLGSPAHSWILWLYLRAGWKIKPTQMFLINMTILELMYSIQCAAQMLNMLILNSETLWRMIFVIVSLSWVGRPLMLTCICIEQYLAVLHPIMFLRYKDLRYRIAFASVVWLMAAAWAVHVTFINIFVEHIFSSVFFIAVMVISFCCVSVLRALKHPGPGDSQVPLERGRDVRNHQKRKAFNTILSGLLIILFTYLPQVSLGLLIVIQTDKELYYCNISPFMNTFNVLGMMITPLFKMYKNGCMNPSKGNFIQHLS